MADKINVAIVGLGVGHSRAEFAVESENANLKVVCDLQEEKAKEAAEEFGCEWSTDLDDVLARDDIDAVGVFTSSGTHCQYAIEAIKAGKHAFTTKPMDIRVEQCDAAIAAAEEAGVVLAVDFGNRYERFNHQVKAAIDTGLLGKVFLGDVRLKWHRKQSYYDGGNPEGWRSRRATEGGSIANQGVHFVDLIYWFLGPVSEVFGRSGTLGHRIETEDISIAHLTFQTGAWGLIETTTAQTPSLGTTVEISGTEGMIIWNNRDVTIKNSDNEDVDLASIVVPDCPANIIEDMAGAIRDGTRPQCPGTEGRKSVEIFTAVYKSSETGQPVVIDQ